MIAPDSLYSDHLLHDTTIRPKDSWNWDTKTSTIRHAVMGVWLSNNMISLWKKPTWLRLFCCSVSGCWCKIMRCLWVATKSNKVINRFHPSHDPFDCWRHFEHHHHHLSLSLSRAFFLFLMWTWFIHLTCVLMSSTIENQMKVGPTIKGRVVFAGTLFFASIDTTPHLCFAQLTV